ncbi:FtsK/SpoIIIE domain-containing protein [Nonomuraea typhae]|uniref:FtsK/SpoIIIE domain-containing protein n=1 Tax=Nonomuraea typhae TaxID=2603600 RepID=A0ABW7ZC20_9ACTN
MIIRLSVRDPELATEHDLEVVAEPATKLASLLGALPPRPCYAGRVKLDPGQSFAESPLVPGMVIGVGEPVPGGRPVPPAAGALRVVAGPDLGRVIWLAPGGHVVGRDRAAAVRLVRDERISRMHARLHVGLTGELTVTDLGSTNGTLVDGTPVTGAAHLTPPALLEVGDDVLRWAPLPPARPRTERGPDGLIAFDRVPGSLPAAPDELDLTLAAHCAAPGLWSRDTAAPDGLKLRVGTSGEPVTVNLREIGVLGVVGPRLPADGLVRWLLIQLATLRAPGDLRLVVISAGGGEHLTWTRWLPHLTGDAVTCLVGNTDRTRADRVEELHARMKSGDRAGEVVVLLDGARTLRDLPGVRELLRKGPSAGIYTICADRRGMHECRAACELDGTDLLLTRPGADLPEPVRPEQLTAETAEEIARALAPMRDRARRAAPVRLLDLLTPMEQWGSGPVTSVVVGADVAGPVHADVSGTTPLVHGAGPDVPRSLVLSLLMANRPDELVLVLAGEVFAPFAACPHVSALLPALDAPGAARLLASLKAEVRRRSSLPGQPHLVLVAEESEAARELARAAAGRPDIHVVRTASLAAGPPGAGVIEQDGAPPRFFRTGGLDEPPPTGDTPATTRLLTWSELGLPRPAAPAPARTQLDLAIEQVIQAAAELAVAAPYRPVLPPLPGRLEGVRRSGRAVPYGLMDDAAHQAQPALAFDPAGAERLVVTGGPGSGRTTFARTLISGLTRHPVWIYAIEDTPGDLAAYAAHCGAVVSPSEPDRVRRLVTWLAAEAARRTAGRSPDPVIVLVVDGWESPGIAPALRTSLRELAETGPPLGIHMVATGAGPGGAPFTRQLMLGHEGAPPGRGVDAGSALPIQIALPPEPGPPLTAARPFPPMPAVVAPGELGRVTGIPIGVGGPDVTTIGLDLLGTGPHTVLVSGPPGSGRSNAALLFAGALVERGVNVLALARPGSPLDGLPGARLLSGTRFTDDDLRAEAAGWAEFAVVVDDLDRLAVTARPGRRTLLQESAAGCGTRTLVLAGDATPMLEGRRHSLGEVVTTVFRSGARIVLAPSGLAAALVHGLVLEPDEYLGGPPGRGYLSAPGRTTLVQLARASRA